MSKIDMAMVFLGDAYVHSGQIFDELRDNQVSFVYEASTQPLAAKLRFVDNQPTDFVMFVGDHELQDGRYPLQRKTTGRASRHSIQRIISLVKDSRSA